MHQPYAKHLDLTEPADTIRAKTLEMIRDDPTFCSQEEWSAQLKAKIEAKQKQSQPWLYA